MENAARQSKQAELDQLRSQVQQLEAELADKPGEEKWQPQQYYAAYFATAGFMLGLFGGATSLLINVIGSVVVGQHPLRLIQVYLTFPLGDKALSADMDSGMTLAIGCCLYLGTGMLLGVPFHMIMTFIFGGSLERPKFIPDPLGLYLVNAQGIHSLLARLGVATVLGISMWLVHFYAILSWLQPLLFDGSWIVSDIPWWVAALTHVVFAWTMALVYPLGVYVPYELQTEK